MAKKSAKKSKNNQSKKKDAVQKKKGGMALHLIVVLSGLLFTAIFFIQSTVILLVGMVPSFVALVVDTNRQKTKALSVAALNVCGCMPFLMDLWSHDSSFDKALDIITSPMAVVVMYSAAALGYLINWAVSNFVANILVQRGHKRKQDIKKRQADLIKRWGREVTGELALDEQGFALADAVKPVARGNEPD